MTEIPLSTPAPSPSATRASDAHSRARSPSLRRVSLPARVFATRLHPAESRLEKGIQRGPLHSMFRGRGREIA